MVSFISSSLTHWIVYLQTHSGQNQIQLLVSLMVVPRIQLREKKVWELTALMQYMAFKMYNICMSYVDIVLSEIFMWSALSHYLPWTAKTDWLIYLLFSYTCYIMLTETYTWSSFDYYCIIYGIHCLSNQNVFIF